MPLAKAIDILKQEANNNKLDKVVVSHLIEAVSGDSGLIENQVAAAS
jgi:hypothetical protein